MERNSKGKQQMMKFQGFQRVMIEMVHRSSPRTHIVFDGFLDCRHREYEHQRRHVRDGALWADWSQGNDRNDQEIQIRFLVELLPQILSIEEGEEGRNG